MVENLQSLCGNADEDFGWELRGTLQSEPRIILLATATRRFGELSDARQPFFELFRIVPLERLDTDACRGLWETVSGEKTSGREIRPLEILTGGNPCLLVIVAGFARNRSMRRLIEELVTLVDDHTEYFRGHLENLAKIERRVYLAKIERRVYLAVIDLWWPSATSEIAARARMDVRTVSAMLGRLCEREMVLAEGSARKRLYFAAERLYSIYYQLRREGDEAAIVHNLILFMAAFYSEIERTKLWDMLISEARYSPPIREGVERAMGDVPELQARDGKLETVIADYDEAIRLEPGHAEGYSSRGFAKLMLHRLEDAMVDFDVAIRLKPDCAEYYSNRGVVKLALNRSENALIDHDEAVQLKPDRAEYYSNRGFAKLMLHRLEDAIADFDEAIRLKPGRAQDYSIRGTAKAELGRTEEAIADHDKALEVCEAGDAPEARTQIARMLSAKCRSQIRLNQTKEALNTFRALYAEFLPGDDTPTHGISYLVPELIAAGIPECGLLEILSEDKGKSAALEPLLIALRQRMGETVRAPAEMMEVAGDIRKQIEEAEKSGAFSGNAS